MKLAVEPRTVLTLAVENLRRAILEGVFTPGQRLVEADLMARLRISRPSLREALRTLEAERLIVITPNRGPSVAILSWETAQQIYKVRALLEGEAAALCAARPDKGVLERMETALKAFASAVKAIDPAGRIKSTSDFYEAIQTGSDNQIIEELLQGLLSRINYLRTRSMANGQRARESLKEMTAIRDAIRAGKPDAARAASHIHIENASKAAELAFAAAANDKSVERSRRDVSAIAE
ncbi:GntR family transcriptional regulator [Rhizobium puerariae]|uniref:GntR family transcriptional regulator n=1 Tax=Rhizobium puerariae TaxID=1585791 RepID=A0ABV6AN19_9HYPH